MTVLVANIGQPSTRSANAPVAEDDAQRHSQQGQGECSHAE
jgi:hypothetical protein